MRALHYIVVPEEEGRTVRSLVPRRFHLGVHAFRRLKVHSSILVNGEPVHADARLHAGDALTILLDDTMSTEDTVSVSSSPVHGDELCTIRYLDEDMIIVSKGAPLATLPGSQGGKTLREYLAAQLGLDEKHFIFRPVNRLDKGTSGLLVIARHDHAQHLLTAQLHSPDFVREYLAVTEGIPAPPSGIIDAPIARGEGVRRCVREDGRKSITYYETERISDSRALVRLRLETGRTHQIRVHLSHLGTPICGDYLYGTELAELPGRFALHSAHLVCRQPITGRLLDLSEPLPSSLSVLL